MSQSIIFPPISVKNMTYFYPSKLVLDDINFTLEHGSITALVGPNGAGKSTLLRNIAGLDSPYSGQITIAGIPIDENPRLAHTYIGYLSDDFGLYDDLLVKDVLEFIGGCHGLTDSMLQNRIQSITKTLRLESVIDKKCNTLCRGWRQRVGIGMAIIHSPKILMLDEPASGLDPEARSELSTILKSLQSEGMTILVSSHILAELEEYCTAMLVLREGEIQEHVTLSAHQQSQRQMMVARLSLILTDSQITTLQQKFSAYSHHIAPDKLSIQFEVSMDRNDHHTLLKQLLEHDFYVCSFVMEEVSLQSLYLQIAHKNS